VAGVLVSGQGWALDLAFEVLQRLHRLGMQRREIA